MIQGSLTIGTFKSGLTFHFSLFTFHFSLFTFHFRIFSFTRGEVRSSGFADSAGGHFSFDELVSEEGKDSTAYKQGSCVSVPIDAGCLAVVVCLFDVARSKRTDFA